MKKFNKFLMYCYVCLCWQVSADVEQRLEKAVDGILKLMKRANRCL